MRHNKTINHLGRKSAHRGAMLSNMASSLILHKRITTTLAKAKVLRTYVEPLITRTKEEYNQTKEQATHSRRVVFSYLQDKEAVAELFREVGPKVKDRPGGYTRILKTGNRIGDNAEMCIIELVDFNEAMLGTKDAKAKAKASTRRSRGAGTGKKKAETESTEKVKAKKSAKEEVQEEVVETPEEPVDEAQPEQQEPTPEEPEEEKKD